MRKANSRPRNSASQAISGAQSLAHQRELDRERKSRQATEAKLKVAAAEIDSLERQRDIAYAITRRRGQVEPWAMRKRSTSRGQASAVVVFSDWHCEEIVTPSTVNGTNEFNPTVAQRRIKKVFDRSLELLEHERKLVPINSVVLALLGDFISGYIHEELEENNAMAPLPAIRFVEELLESGIRYLLKHGNLAEIIIPTANGNHGRTTRRKRFATSAANSYEFHMYHSLAKYLRSEPRVKMLIGEGYHNWVDIQGHPCRFHHGDAIRYEGGVGGLYIPVNKAIAAWNKTRVACVDFFGHFHTWCQDNLWCSNGSLIGYNAYAIEKKIPFQPPWQTFSVIDRKHSLPTKVLKLFCE